MNHEPWVELKEKIETRVPDRITDFLSELPSNDRGRAISHLDKETTKELFRLIPNEFAAEILEDLSDEHAADLIELLPPKDAVNIFHELPSADKADILADVDKEKAEAILDEMTLDEARQTRNILNFPEDSAGGIMQSEFLTYVDTYTVGDVLADLQTNGDIYSDYQTQYVYITNEHKKLLGVLRIRDLIFSKPTTQVSKLGIKEPLYVSSLTDLDELVQIFEDNHFLGLPVVDKVHRVIGIVRRKDVEEAYGERNKDTYLKASGIIGGEELRSMPVWQRSGRRLSWLSVNILLNVLAASIIAMYQDTLASVIALAVFLPIISDMSGCSGNQAVAVSIRELTLGLAKPQDLWHVLSKEMMVGVINGLVLGGLLAGVAMLWKGNPYLGLVVGGALAVNTVMAVSIGGLIPLLLQKFGKDPALASGPILTTVTDMCGFFFALAFATIMLPYL